jgi:DNA-binding MarR family transcriptional regulator
MTNRVDRLAARGFVERLPDPSDRRGVLVQLTATGRKTVDGALDGLLKREHELLAGLRASDHKQLAGLLRQLVAPFDDES